MAMLTLKDGTRLFYKDYGRGEVVVFVHGWCINADSWEYIMHRLTDGGFRCVAYDQRGCGRSDQPWDGYDYKSLAADLAQLLEALDLQNVVLVGHSLGGGVIVQYLADFGKSRVKKAIAISTCMPGLARTAVNKDGVDSSNYEMVRDLIKNDRAAYVRSQDSVFFGLPNPDSKVSRELIEWCIGLTLQASSVAALGMLATSFFGNQEEELKSIDLPFLVLHGDRDISCPIPLTAERTHQLMKNSRLKILPGKPHGMYISDPDEVSTEIIEFIGNLPV